MDIVEDLRLNHEFCPKEVMLAAADEINSLRTALEIARGALADIYTSRDMTLNLARKKAKRIYLETGLA